MSQQQLTVKAYLKKGCQQKRLLEQVDEIRRFGVDYDVSTNYDYLVAKIRSVFPGLVNKSITLYWKDSDNDLIAFSSDDELMEAMKGIREGLFRVFIVENKTPKSESQPSGNTTGLVHPGVTCDGCNGPVQGVRYKCTVCPDYDLCNQCKLTGMHSEHDMMSIDRPKLPFFHFGMPGAANGFMAPPIPPFMGHMPPFNGQMPPPPPYGCFPSSESGPEQSVEECRARRKEWKKWCRQSFGPDHRRKHKKDKKEKKEMKEGKKVSSSSSSESESDSPAGNYLENIGHSVAAMLDPLGIDVEVDVEHHGNRRRCQRGGMGRHCGGRMRCGPWGMRGSGRHGCPWGRGHGGPQGPAFSTTENQQKSSDQKPCSTNEPERQNDQHTTNTETVEMAGVNCAGSLPDHGWTVLDNSACAAEVENATMGVKDLNVSDSIAPGADSVQVPDPAVAEALNSMMSMGYHNEGGWLTNLLTYYKGDIGRVLDTIHAKK